MFFLSDLLETQAISMKASDKYTIHMRDSSVGNMSRVWAECPRNCGPILGNRDRFAVQRNVQTSCEDTLLFNVYLRLSLRGSLGNTECRRTFTLLCVFILQKKKQQYLRVPSGTKTGKETFRKQHTKLFAMSKFHKIFEQVKVF